MGTTPLEIYMEANIDKENQIPTNAFTAVWLHPYRTSIKKEEAVSGT